MSEGGEKDPGLEGLIAATGQGGEKRMYICQLMQAVDVEMATYRQRQLMAFREALIALGVVTWGAHALPGPPVESLGFWSRILAAVVCWLLGHFGAIIIIEYRDRIYHVRRARDKLVAALKVCKESPFPPTPCGAAPPPSKKREWFLWVVPESLLQATSRTYCAALLTIAVATAGFSLLSAFLGR